MLRSLIKWHFFHTHGCLSQSKLSNSRNYDKLIKHPTTSELHWWKKKNQGSKIIAAQSDTPLQMGDSNGEEKVSLEFGGRWVSPSTSHLWDCVHDRQTKRQRNVVWQDGKRRRSSAKGPDMRRIHTERWTLHHIEWQNTRIGRS